jgi:hypothetical protein
LHNFSPIKLFVRSFGNEDARRRFRVRRIALLLLLVVVTGCTKPSGTAENRKPAGEPSSAKTALVGSAAAPGGAGQSTQVIDKVLGSVVARLDALPTAEALQQKEIHLQDLGSVLVCASAPAIETTEVPILACQIGPFVNVIEAHALFWEQEGKWKAQLYPEAQAPVTKARRDYFASLGENCPIGCAGGFKVLRQKGNLLLAVVDLSSVASHSTEEVQLLERDNGQWKVLWVPVPETYRFSHYPRVSLPSAGIDSFDVTYEDGAKASWVRKDGTFVSK